LGLDIHSAHISTFGERAVDVFYVTAASAKVAAGERQTAIRERLTSVLAGAAS
jgi:[protein-PII] uridylyltransferase